MRMNINDINFAIEILSVMSMTIRRIDNYARC